MEVDRLLIKLSAPPLRFINILAQTYLNPANQLVIKHQDSDLQNYPNGQFLLYFKERKNVVVDETYEHSKEISNAPGSTTIVIIKQGEYPIRFDGGYYEVMILNRPAPLFITRKTQRRHEKHENILWNLNHYRMQ